MKVLQNIPLAPYTTFHIGGPADYFITAKSIEEIYEAVRWAKEKNLPFFILGTGANILVGDRGFRGIVIKNEANKFNLKQGVTRVGDPRNSSAGNGVTEASFGGGERQDPDILLIAESGATIENLIKFTLEKGLSGFEHFAGIPSSVGGALWQNLHFLSPDRKKTVYIGDIVEEAELLQIINHNPPAGGQITNVKQEYFHFSYDYSILHDNHDIVLSAIFQLAPEDPKIIQERIDANLKWRKEKHPENAANTSAGSIFKKIEGYGAGRLIEQVDLKGKQIGGAKISEKHANFIVNVGGAKATDVRKLITLVQKTVKKKLGLELQTEISFIGEF